MTTFYKDKGEVKLKPGQTLGFTAGKGYFAAGSPTPPKPSPAPAKPSSKAEPTATRPVAAKTPTAPPSRASVPPTTRRAGEPDADTARRSDARASRSPASMTPKLSESAALYTRASDVPLSPGQTIGYAGERGYYAAGRPQPTKASTTPKPSTVKVTAVSTRASTVSPLVEHVETHDGRTTIRLSHATKPADNAAQERKAAAHASEGSAKPSRDAAQRTAVQTKKASSRVHEQLAKNRERTDHAKSGIGHHPGRAKRDVLANAASAGGVHHLDHKSRAIRRPGLFEFHPDALLSALLASSVKIDAHGEFYYGGFRVDVTAEASIDKPEVTLHDGRLVLAWGDNTLASIKLDGVLDGFAKLVAEADSTSQKLRDALSGTVQLPGGETVTTDLAVGSLSVSISSGGVTTTIGLKFPDTFFVSTEVSEPLSPHPPLSSVDVHIKSTVELTPEEKKHVPNPEKKTVPARQPAYKTPIRNTNPTGTFVLPTGPRVGGGVKGGSGNGGGDLGGTSIDNPSVLIAAYVNHGRSGRSTGVAT